VGDSNMVERRDAQEDVVSLGGIHADVSNCHAVSENTTDPNSISVNHANDLDGG